MSNDTTHSQRERQESASQRSTWTGPPWRCACLLAGLPRMRSFSERCGSRSTLLASTSSGVVASSLHHVTTAPTTIRASPISIHPTTHCSIRPPTSQPARANGPADGQLWWRRGSRPASYLSSSSRCSSVLAMGTLSTCTTTSTITSVGRPRQHPPREAPQRTTTPCSKPAATA